MSRPSPPFLSAALVAIVLTASSGAAISVGLHEPQEASPWWFLQRVDSALNPDDDGEPPVIFNAHVSPMIMKQGDPNVAGVEICAWVRDEGAVETVYAEVGGRYVPLIDLTRSGRFEGSCSSNLPAGVVRSHTRKDIRIMYCRSQTAPGPIHPSPRFEDCRVRRTYFEHRPCLH